jgi:hypothetical protein
LPTPTDWLFTISAGYYLHIKADHFPITVMGATGLQKSAPRFDPQIPTGF